jgi:putative sterol carrier protein
MVDRFKDPALQASLKGYTKNLHFKFTDVNEDYVIKIVDGTTATIVKEVPEKPDMTVTTTTEVLSGIMDKKINAMAAYMQRKIQTKGSMEDLMKLQKLML